MERDNTSWMGMKARACALLLGVVGCCAVSAASEHCPGYAAGEKQVLWGDLHVHTSFSMDAYVFGTRNDPRDALAFARGQELTLGDNTTRVRIDRPLDFTAITDHSEFYNSMYVCTDPQFADSKWCGTYRELAFPDPSMQGFREVFLPLLKGDKATEAPFCSDDGVDCKELRRLQWPRVQHYANAANAPCAFTSFVALEWSATPNLYHWHRNVIFANENVTEHPVNYVDQPSVADMWRMLDRECRAEDGCDVVAIPHNINLASGGGFDVETASDADLKLRARYERIAEIHQHKGNSECLTAYGDDNADCEFEYANILPQWHAVKPEDLPEAQRNQFRRSYYRTVLARGLQTYEKAGFNPLQLGAIASTDTHAGTPGYVQEEGWQGTSGVDLDPSARLQKFGSYNPGGLAAVWAEENTRESIFGALKRREVYATSGPRITLKYYSTFEQGGDPCQAAFNGKTAAVMGGRLAAQGTLKPRFVVNALQDNNALARVDIVRGVLTDGGVEETVTSFAVGGPDGDSSACIAWTEQDFDPAVPAFWYARVLEVPTKRWSKFMCEENNSCAENPDMDRMIQERAWASPIWNLP